MEAFAGNILILMNLNYNWQKAIRFIWSRVILNGTSRRLSVIAVGVVLFTLSYTRPISNVGIKSLPKRKISDWTGIRIARYSPPYSIKTILCPFPLLHTTTAYWALACLSQAPSRPMGKTMRKGRCQLKPNVYVRCLEPIIWFPSNIG